PSRQGDRQFIASWVAIAAPALATCDCAENDMSALEQAAIGVSLANLHAFPWIADRVAAGTLKLHGWWFDLEHGQLWAHDRESNGFKLLA
ncbi:MAG: carbonic anhydrase, partial [Alphaproteobacteria bacterium]|nr:carbonic anhydrase [Alphaproteobacteria bacterium]